MWIVKCECKGWNVWNVKCGVECGVWSVKCGVESVECKGRNVWNVWNVWSVWSVECKV